MYCAKCGSKCRDGAKFCANCGAEIIAPGGKKGTALITGFEKPNSNKQNNNNSKNNKSDNKGARGLFSKKTQTCVRCGREFDARISKLYCRECADILKQKYNESKGYVDLFDYVSNEKHKGDERFYDEVMRHRDEILENNKPFYDIYEDKEYLKAMADFLEMPVKEAAELIDGLNRDSIVLDISYGDLLNVYFVMPAEYPGVVVNLDDVFAVGYGKAHDIARYNAELIVTLFLTNDPYAPAFYFRGVYPKGPFGLTKNKEIREVLKNLYTCACPNLSYPVQELKTLKKTIKQEGMVRGNMGVKSALDQIDRALLEMFVPEDEIPELNLRLLGRYGYIVRSRR